MNLEGNNFIKHCKYPLEYIQACLSSTIFDFYFQGGGLNAQLGRYGKRCINALINIQHQRNDKSKHKISFHTSSISGHHIRKADNNIDRTNLLIPSIRILVIFLCKCKREMKKLFLSWCLSKQPSSVFKLSKYFFKIVACLMHIDQYCHFRGSNFNGYNDINANFNCLNLRTREVKYRFSIKEVSMQEFLVQSTARHILISTYSIE